MLKRTENRQKRLDAARLYEVKVLSVETAEKRRKRLQAGRDYNASSRGAGEHQNSLRTAKAHQQRVEVVLAARTKARATSAW